MREPSLTHPSAAIFLGDCLDVLAEMPDNSVDAIVTDPPYGLGFMGKDWDDLPPGLPWAQECLRVLKPGGHLLAFGGTRTWHRLAVAVEDAGFEVRDSIAWLYGSGFPKSLDVSKAIDKAAGATRTEVVERRTDGAGNGSVVGLGSPSVMATEYDVLAPATEAAAQWQGWGTALKPAFEPIVVARKPLAGTVAANVQAHGTGALNIDGCRVGTGDDRTSGGPAGKSTATHTAMGEGWHGGQVERPTGGRWPANVLLDGSQADALDAESGTTRSGQPREDRGTGGIWQGGNGVPCGPQYGDAGGASRFFPTFRYQAKAPTRERPVHIAEDGTKTAHPTVKPLALMRWLVRLVTPAGGTVLDTFTGSGATVEAAIQEGFFALGIEREESYLPLIQVRLDRNPEESSCAPTSSEASPCPAETASTASAGGAPLSVASGSSAPADATDALSPADAVADRIRAALDAAESYAALQTVYRAHQDDWTAGLTEYAAARRAALEGNAA